MFSVGSGGAVIAGWVLLPSVLKAHGTAPAGAGEYCPRLAAGVIVRRNSGGGALFVRRRGSPDRLVCEVNASGLHVVEALDGTNTLQSLAENIHPGADDPAVQRSAVSVVSFLALLAQAGLLADPFFVTLHAVEVSQ